MKGKEDEQGSSSSSSKRRWMNHLKDSLNFIYSLFLFMINALRSLTRRQLHPTSNKWSEIEDDVFGLILQRLCLTDFLRTQFVCSNWRSMVARSIANKNCPPLPELPLLFLQTKNDPNNNFSFFNMSTKRVSGCSSPASLEESAYCHGTVQGWLIMADNNNNNEACCNKGFRNIFFFNPLTKARVLMPSRLNFEGSIKKIVASTKPTDPNCVVACLFVDCMKLAFSGISDDSWTLIKGSLKDMIVFKEIEILDGKIFALNHQMFNSVIVCDLQNKPVNPKLLLLKHGRDEYLWKDRSQPHFDFYRFLAVDSSSGELLLIYAFYKPVLYDGDLWGTTKNEILTFQPSFTKSQVFKLGMSIMGGEVEWIEVKNLGNRMFFVGEHKSLVVWSKSKAGDLVQGARDLIKNKSTYLVCQVPNIGRLEQWKGVMIGRYCELDRKKTTYYVWKGIISDRLHSSIWFIPSFW